MTVPDATASRPSSPLFLLSLAALGIVFGDLGTSPLYALQEAFHPERGVPATPDNVIGIVSLFLYSLVLMVSLKYVLVLMRADNRGEGGILALMALITGHRQRGEQPGRIARLSIILALLGAAMLFGDGVITPAISVLSAVEGLQVATPALATWVVPSTIVILVLLFAIQPYGSGKVGIVFGPILALWFIVIAVLGAMELLRTPAILSAFNPLHGIDFFLQNGMRGFAALGAVVLCLTGGEALYADMGHFGRRPIRLAWYGLALPALLLNYLGQGALLLAHPEASARPFYSLVPAWAIYPMVGLATLATIVASQALIAAVFSLTRQAAQLGFFPRVHVIHTSVGASGQIYLPFLNWALMLATIGVVLTFRSSEALAAAFGLAVSATMTMTTLLFALLALRRWHWPLHWVGAIAGTFLAIDLAFLGANALKFLDGGWLSLVIGGLIFLVMRTWDLGQRLMARERASRKLPLELFLESLSYSPVHRIEGTGVFLCSESGGVPLVLLHHLKYNQVLHRRVILLTITTEEIPRVPPSQRMVVEPMTMGFERVTVRYGFMEDPEIPEALHPDDPMMTTYYLGNHTPVVRRGGSRIKRALMRLFVFLRQNEHSVTLRLGLPPNRVVELGARIEL